MLITILLIFLCIFLWFSVKFSHWKSLGFLYSPAKCPLGSGPGIGITEHSSYFVKREYEKFKDKSPAFGAYLMAMPILVPTDPKLIKEIFVKSFETFQERGFTVPEEADPLSQHLLFKTGQEWRDLRAKLSPTFTSGKIKMMFPNVVRSADRMIEHLLPYAEHSRLLEIKEVYGSYSTEVIADVAFGLEINCLGNPENDFRKMGEIVFKPTILENLKLFFLISFPKLAHKLKVGYTNRKVIEFFSKTIRETLEYREKMNVERNDFFQLLMNIRKREGMTFTEFSANSFIFFLAG